MGLIIAFVSIKGGVGKTTVALEAASSLANDFHKRVLLVDANFSAPNLGMYLNLPEELTLHDVLAGEGLHAAIYETHGFDIVPASLDFSKEIDPFKLKKVLARIKKRYDYIVLDSSTNYQELTPVIAAADEIYVVTTPDSITLATSLKAAELAKQRKTPIKGIVINKIRNPRYEMGLGDIERESEIPVIARVKDHKKIDEARYHKKPITIHDKGNDISREIRRFSSALCGEPEEPSGLFQKFLPFNSFVKKEKVNRELLRNDFYNKQL